MNNSLIVRGPGGPLSIDFALEAKIAKDKALALAGQIQQVTNPSENGYAVAAQSALNDIVKQVEIDRKAAKAPFLAYMDTLDTAARTFVAPAKAELNRVSQLVGDFAVLEAARVRSAEAARKLNAETLERERQEALAQAKDHDELDAINERYDDLMRDLPSVTPARADGQVIKSEWDIQITDIWLLAQCHRNCVKDPVPKLSVIKELLDLGMELRGVKAAKVVHATVRKSQPVKAIEV